MGGDRLHRSAGRFSPIQSRTSWRKARSAGSSSTNSVVLSQVGDGIRSGPQCRAPVAEHDLVPPHHAALERDVLALGPDFGTYRLAGKDRAREPRLDAVQPLRPVVGADPQDRVRRYAETCGAMENGPIYPCNLGARGIATPPTLIPIQALTQP